MCDLNEQRQKEQAQVSVNKLHEYSTPQGRSLSAWKNTVTVSYETFGNPGVLFKQTIAAGSLSKILESGELYTEEQELPLTLKSLWLWNPERITFLKQWENLAEPKQTEEEIINTINPLRTEEVYRRGVKGPIKGQSTPAEPNEWVPTELKFQHEQLVHTIVQEARRMNNFAIPKTYLCKAVSALNEFESRWDQYKW